MATHHNLRSWSLVACQTVLSLFVSQHPRKTLGASQRRIREALFDFASDKLFDIENINDVLVSNDKLTINLKSGTWEDTVPKVGAAIHEVLTSGGSAISEAVTSSLLTPEEVKNQVQKILDDLVNPAVASHGGFVNLVTVSDNNVVLEFGGGCHGCGMANVTLKYGVEQVSVACHWIYDRSAVFIYN